MSVPQRSKAITEILTDATPNWTPAVDDSRLARVAETAIIYYFNKSNVWVRLDLSASSLGYNIVSNIADFNALIAGSTAGTWVIIGDVVLDANKAMPAGVTLEFTGGEISGAFTVTGNNTGLSANLVQIFDSTVTLAGTWNVKEFYPQWFGAVADGTTDDAPAIQKAIDNPDVKPVFIPKGDYMISSTLSIPSNSEITNNGTILRDTGVAAFDMLEGDSVDNVIIRGGKLDGVTLTDNLDGNRFCGIRIWDSSTVSPCTNILIDGVEVTNTTSGENQAEGSRGAIILEDTINGVVQNCNVHGNKATSVMIQGASNKDCKVLDCYLYDNDTAGSGISGNQHTGLIVQGNHVYNTKYTSISVNGKNSQILGNIVYNAPNNYAGITIGHDNANSNASGTSCIGNLIRDCGTTTAFIAGIVVMNSDDVIIQGNTIKDNANHGIRFLNDVFDSTGNCRISGNLIDNNVGYGILMEWGENHVIQANTIINNDNTGVFVDGTKDYTLNNLYVKDNLFKDNGNSTGRGGVVVNTPTSGSLLVKVYNNIFEGTGTLQYNGIWAAGANVTVYVKGNDFDTSYSETLAYRATTSATIEHKQTKAEGVTLVTGGDLLNSWTAALSLGYWKDNNGVVHLQGAATGGTISTAAFNLPVGYRPAVSQSFATIGDTNKFAFASVSSTGDVKLYLQTTNHYVNNISFLAAATDAS